MQVFVYAKVIRREISPQTVIECISVTISCCETFHTTFRFVLKHVSSQQIKFGYDGFLAGGLRTQKNIQPVARRLLDQRAHTEEPVH